MSTTRPLRIIVGIGNAGVTVLDLLAVKNPGMTGLLAINNDPESLASSVVSEIITVPEGDPGEGFRSIDEEFGRTVTGASSVFLCGGLGGVTTSFLLPALAIHAKSAGIPTLACVGMPFSFEGKQKRLAAEEAIGKLHGICDAVMVIDNDRLSGGAPSTAAVGEAFELSDRALLASVLALSGMFSTSGPVKISRADLHAVLGVEGALTHFGFGSSSGSNRLHEALAKALKSPLLLLPGKGAALREATTVLIFLRGPADLSFAEVQLAVAEMERMAGEGCVLKVGVQADAPPESPLELYITTSTGRRAPSKAPLPQPESIPVHSPRENDAPRHPVTRNLAPSLKQGKPAPMPANKQTQGTLDLDTPQRGRFDKSERTIVDGEDLDQPTFIRRGIKLPSPHRT